MALRVCNGCSTAYAAGLPGCPHCGGTDHHEEGTMPKITRHGGPTVAGEQRPDLEQPAGVGERDDKGGASSPGSSSSASSAKPKKSAEPKKQTHQSPAPTTESPSGQDRKGSSTARTTGGNGTA